MNPDLLVYTAEYEIRAGEIDCHGKLIVPELLQLMQETSLKHIIQLKASIWDMKESSWVLLAERLDINHLPDLGDKIIIKTYPAGVRRIYAYRDYWVYDQDGNILATASTTWTLMNLSTRKIVPIPDSLVDLPLPEGFNLLEHSDMRLKLMDGVYTTELFRIGYFHLDWNDHVNNIHYTRFMLETVPSFLSTSQVSRMQIVFKGEALLGDEITVHSMKDEDSQLTYHKVVDANNKDICMAIVTWAGN